MQAPKAAVPAARGASPALWVAVCLIAFASLAGPALLVRYGPTAPAIVRHITRHRHVVPKTVLPAVQPSRYEAVTPSDARAINAALPYTTDPVPPARPFRLAEQPADQARAIDCLAAAQLYEAGRDADGERAVAQVVLNRLRHPAFPKTVCGVVFQGSERRTGCQFSFTCDGTLERVRWPAAAWAEARLIATAALSGAVYAKVGYATHYHTVAVVPYWIDELDKITSVGAHLFYRWSGWWGTPAAFRQQRGGSEPVIAKLAAYSPAHSNGALSGDAMTPEQRRAAVAAAIAKLPAPATGDSDSFLVTIDPAMPADDLPRLAVQSCGSREHCKFMAWNDPRLTPRRVPHGGMEVATMAFAYLRDRANNFDKMLWNCRIYTRPLKNQCMKAQVLPEPAASPSGELPNDPENHLRPSANISVLAK